MQFNFKETIKSFVEDEFFIQLLIPENKDITQLIQRFHETWINHEYDYQASLAFIKALPEMQETPHFFINDQLPETPQAATNFVLKMVFKTFDVVFKIADQFTKTHHNHSQESLDAVNDSGIDVTLEKSFIDLSKTFQAQFLKALKQVNFIPFFEIFIDDLVEELSNNQHHTTSDLKMEATYLLHENLNNILDTIDDMEIELKEDEFEIANQQSDILIFYEMMFDRLILLYEHLEYCFLFAKDSLEHFHKINITERYEELAILDNMYNESKPK